MSPPVLKDIRIILPPPRQDLIFKHSKLLLPLVVFPFAEVILRMPVFCEREWSECPTIVKRIFRLKAFGSLKNWLSHLLQVDGTLHWEIWFYQFYNPSSNPSIWIWCSPKKQRTTRFLDWNNHVLQPNGSHAPPPLLYKYYWSCENKLLLMALLGLLPLVQIIIRISVIGCPSYWVLNFN